MSDIDALQRAYAQFVSLPWTMGLAPPQRVWMVIYSPPAERRIRARLAAFEAATVRAGKRWITIDVTQAFGEWLGTQPYRESYFKKPQLLSGAALRAFEQYVVKTARDAAGELTEDPEAVVAVVGVGSLFPFMKVSRFIESLAPAVRGRLVVLFPGERDGNNYRLLEARDGWNYLATPITVKD